MLTLWHPAIQAVRIAIDDSIDEVYNLAADMGGAGCAPVFLFVLSIVLSLFYAFFRESISCSNCLFNG